MYGVQDGREFEFKVRMLKFRNRERKSAPACAGAGGRAAAVALPTVWHVVLLTCVVSREQWQFSGLFGYGYTLQ
jgi:hypothetical protein